MVDNAIPTNNGNARGDVYTTSTNYNNATAYNGRDDDLGGLNAVAGGAGDVIVDDSDAGDEDLLAVVLIGVLAVELDDHATMVPTTTGAS